MKDLMIPTNEQLEEGIDAFNKKEPRAYVYFLALNHIDSHWGVQKEMAQGIQILLDAWHRTFYRYGNYKPELIEDCIDRNIELINGFKSRSISDLAEGDEDGIKSIFDAFLDALRGGKRRSPVAVAKSLHLLVPSYFPLWDTDIAIGYSSWWVFSEFGVKEYIPFCWKMKYLHEKVKRYKCVRQASPGRSGLKLIDEYNYSKYTKKWIA